MIFFVGSRYNITAEKLALVKLCYYLFYNIIAIGIRIVYVLPVLCLIVTQRTDFY